MRRLLVVASLLLTACIALPALATPPYVGVQGVLRSAGGAVAPDGKYTFMIRIYDSQGATKELWKELEPTVQVSGGLFTFQLGSTDPATPIPEDLFAKNPNAWLGVQILPEEAELARVALTSVPYAFRANAAGTAAVADKALALDCVTCVKGQAVDFAYAASNSKGGPAIDLGCTGCVQSDEIADGAVATGKLADGAVTPDKLAAGAVLDAAVGFNYAGSDGKGGPATSAKEAALAKDLQCSGCVGADELGADVVAKLLAPATTTTLGGVIAGAHLSVDAKGLLAVKEGEFLPAAGGALAGDLDLGKHQIKAFRVENAGSAPTCDAGNAGGLYFDSTQKIFFGCDGAKWWPLNNNTPGSQSNPASTCKAILDAGGAPASGSYWLSAGGQPYQTWCDMTTDGGGWTCVATIAMGDGNSWKHSSPNPNNWESTAAFGNLDLSANVDFKSPAFANVSGKAILITYKTGFLLRTDGACLGDTNLRAKFAGLGWDSGGSQDYTSFPASTHPCVIAALTAISGEKALVNGNNPSRLFLKAGEADGAQDSNKDRAYLSTSIRTNVDVPRGLGAFNSGACSAPNCENDVGGFNPDGSDSDITPPGPSTDFYGIWVR